MSSMIRPSPMSGVSTASGGSRQHTSSQTQQQFNANKSASSVPSVSYEKFAPRSTAQISRLARIAVLTAGPTARATTLLEKAHEISPETDSESILMTAMKAPKIDTPDSQSKMLDIDNNGNSLTDFQYLNETLQQSDVVIEQLTQQLKHTTSLRLALRASFNIAEDISNRHTDLIRHSGELSAAADRLQEEEAILTKHAEEIGMPLQHYDAVDRISSTVGVLFKGKAVVRGLAKIKVDNDEFPELLNDIDNAIQFFGDQCGGKQALLQAEAEMKRSKQQNQNQPGNQLEHLQSGSVEYFRRALALQEAALDLIKEAVAERITSTATQILAALNVAKKGKYTGTVQADQLEASLIYTRFHGISSRSNRLISLLRARLHRGEAYSELLQHCRSTYCTARESLLRETVRAHMDKLKEQHGPIGMTRLASVFLIRLCTIETSLYLDFFGEKKDLSTEATKANDEKVIRTTARQSKGSQALSDESNMLRRDMEYNAYLTSLCSELHRTVRRSLLVMTELDTLCQVVSVLREERSMASSSPTTIAAARAISSVIQDAQERLIFCATSTLTKEVIRFKATPEDLNYPDKLIKKRESDSQVQPAEGTQTDAAVAKQLHQVYESWFPPMRTVLRILSKIFRVVETKVFEDMALQSVQACTRCLRDGAKYIQSHKGQIHSDLFLVKHLLILREQLSPFDIELRSVERQLDFSDAGKAVARFLANRNRRLFSMSTENAVITLLREGVSVQESAVDSKRDLEDALRSACNDFIEHTSRMVASDLLATSETYKMSDAMSLGQNDQKIQAEYVLNLLRKTLDSAPITLQVITNQMSLYLDNSATQNILLKPVNRKIIRSIDEIRKVITQISLSNNTHGWDDEKIIQFKELSDSLEREVRKSSKVSSSSKQ